MRLRRALHVDARRSYHQHTWLKHGIAHTARAYGIGATNEPNFYVYPDTLVRHRPDTTFTRETSTSPST